MAVPLGDGVIDLSTAELSDIQLRQPTVEQITGSTKHISLAPVVSKRDNRSSTLDSAVQAEGIFDLYGAETPESHTRNSLYNAHDDQPVQHDVEELNSPTSPVSWTGPFSTLRSSLIPSPQPSPSPSPIPNPSHPSETHLHPSQTSQTSTPSRIPIPIPQLTLTPDKSHLRASTLTSHSTSTSISLSISPSPKHPSIARLSPRVGGGGFGNGEGSRGSSRNGSTLSFGSVQYPGEEDDSFHVRSTYARLEAEGVHGDGWDPGVERTRGGPSSGKRATVYEASKEGDVGEQEKEYLANLDRYGFVNENIHKRSEARIALIPSSPLRKIPKIPSKSPLANKTPAQPPPTPAFGSHPDGPSPKAPDVPRMQSLDGDKNRKKESERVGKWMKMMGVKNRDEGGNVKEWQWRSDALGNKLLRRVYKGIPDRWRMAAWWTLSEERVRDWKGKGRAKRSIEDLTLDYYGTLDLPSTHDVQIDLDVPRTISGHTLFVTRYGTGQRNLFHVLHCFSLICDTCGYCQGMGPIAATLLCYFDPERTYALMVKLHDVWGMHSIFAPGFPGLLEAFYVQERLIEHLMPDVYQSFQRNMISSSAWGTKWYITLFVNTIPFAQQLRLWDALWLDGRDVIVMMSVAIVWAFRDLLAAPSATFESILSLLSSYFVAEDDDALMRWIRKVLHSPGTKERISAWRSDWARLVKEGKSESALL